MGVCVSVGRNHELTRRKGLGFEKIPYGTEKVTSRRR